MEGSQPVCITHVEAGVKGRSEDEKLSLYCFTSLITVSWENIVRIQAGLAWREKRVGVLNKDMKTVVQL